MKAGFTGTRRGMTERQKQALRALLIAFPIGVLHHGCADGADTEADEIAHDARMQTAGHPTHANAGTHECSPDFMFPPKEDPLDRDTDIARAGSLLIAAPYNQRGERMRGSGTWATVRRARKARVAVLVIRPDGSLEAEDNGMYDQPDLTS